MVVEVEKPDAHNFENRMLSYFLRLNKLGREKLTSYALDLCEIKKYTTKDTNSTVDSDVLMAAHEIKGATEEQKEHDKAIMEDDDF